MNIRSKLSISLFLAGTICLSSCYSISVITHDGQGEAGYDVRVRDPLLRGMQVRTLDTVIRSKLFTKEVLKLDMCEESAVYILEYRQSFGALLHHMVTLGTRKQVRFIYVCSQPQN